MRVSDNTLTSGSASEEVMVKTQLGYQIGYDGKGRGTYHIFELGVDRSLLSFTVLDSIF